MDRIEKTDKNVTGAIDGGMAAGRVLGKGEKRKTDESKLRRKASGKRNRAAAGVRVQDPDKAE